MTSLHWSLSMFTGDTLYDPMNIHERSFSVLSLFFAFMFSASLVSSITTAMTRLQIITSAQSSQLYQLRSFLTDRGISRKLSMRVQRNAQHVMLELKRKMPESSVELLKLISDPLMIEVHFEVHSEILMKHPFFWCFNEVNPAGIRKVCHTAVNWLSLTTGDILFSDLETPTAPTMYFVMMGSMEYKRPIGDLGRLDTTYVVAPQWLCEGALWTSWVHCGTARANTETRLLALDAAKFQDIGSNLSTQHLGKYAEGFVELMNAIERQNQSDVGDDANELSDVIAYAFPELQGDEDEDDDEEGDDEHDEGILRKFRLGGHSQTSQSSQTLGDDKDIQEIPDWLQTEAKPLTLTKAVMWSDDTDLTRSASFTPTKKRRASTSSSRRLRASRISLINGSGRRSLFSRVGNHRGSKLGSNSRRSQAIQMLGLDASKGPLHKQALAALSGCIGRAQHCLRTWRSRCPLSKKSSCKDDVLSICVPAAPSQQGN